MAELPPPNPPAAKRPTSIPGLLRTVDAELYETRRAMAGYGKLNAVWNQMVHGVPEGERRVGIPQFKYVASEPADDQDEDVKAVECIIELRRLPDKNYAPTILAAFCQIHANEMIESVERMFQSISELRQQLHAALNPQAAQQPQVGPANPSAVLGDEEDDGEEVGHPDDDEVVTPRRARPGRRSHE